MARVFAHNTAEEAARFFDLDMIQDAPTQGNKTSKGGTIDLAGIRYFDAYHTRYSHLFDQATVEGQTKMMRDYIYWVTQYMVDGKYLNSRDLKATRQHLYDSFDVQYSISVAELELNRLGLSRADIAAVPKPILIKFFAAINGLKRAVGLRDVSLANGNEGKRPAAFDVRSILAQTMKALSISDPALGLQARRALFSMERSWGSVGPDDLLDVKTAYLTAVRDVIAMTPHRKILSTWISHAEQVGATHRAEMATSDDFWSQYLGPVIELIEQGGHTYKEINQKLRVAAAALTDHGLPERPLTQLKARVAEPVAIQSAAHPVCRLAFGF